MTDSNVLLRRVRSKYPSFFVGANAHSNLGQVFINLANLYGKWERSRRKCMIDAGHDQVDRLPRTGGKWPAGIGERKL